MSNNGIIIDTNGDTYINGVATSVGLYVDGGDDHIDVATDGLDKLNIVAYLKSINTYFDNTSTIYPSGDTNLTFDLSSISDAGESSYGFFILNGNDSFKFIKKATDAIDISSYLYDCSIYASNNMTLGATSILYLNVGNLGINTADPSALLDIETVGTAKAITNILEITNKYNAADMDGTGSAILFNQWYYDVSTPAVANIARIVVGTETEWTSTSSTQDSYMVFETSLDGIVSEKLRIDSNGYMKGLRLGLGVVPTNLLHLHAATAEGILITCDGLAHGMTGELPTNSYFQLRDANGVAGGVLITAASGNASTTALNFQGFIGVTDPTDTIPAVSFEGSKKSGTTRQALGLLETVVQFKTFSSPLLTILGSGNSGFGTVSPSSLIDLEYSGTVKAITNFLELTNTQNAVDMDGTGSAILFNQWYYDASTPAVADIARIVVGTETDWTSTASSQDGYMSFEIALDGVVGEKLRINSAGKATFNGGWTDGTSTILAGALTEVASITNAARDLNIVLTNAYSHVIDLAGCTGSSDGFFINDGTDQFQLMHVAANSLFLTADVYIYQFDSATAGILNATTTMTVAAGTDLYLNGNAIFNGSTIIISGAKTPTNASDTGTTGMVCWDASYIYVCTATNTWKRAGIATWV